jgi:hypothetical protein
MKASRFRLIFEPVLATLLVSAMLFCQTWWFSDFSDSWHLTALYFGIVVLLSAWTASLVRTIWVSAKAFSAALKER